MLPGWNVSWWSIKLLKTNRYPELMNRPGHTFWGLFYDLGSRYWAENCDLSQEMTWKVRPVIERGFQCFFWLISRIFMVEGHRCPQACCGHAKMYLEKGESKHIFMMWCAICFNYGYAVREREWRIANPCTAYIKKMDLSFWVGIHGVTIPKRGFGNNELVLS